MLPKSLANKEKRIAVGITIDGGILSDLHVVITISQKKHMNNSNTERMDGITIDGGMLPDLHVVIIISQKTREQQ